ncbi:MULTISPECIES: NACHT domain-containing protein [unclassified Pseudomonas]|uniref:NACHT domain-containing protein n=1 Tax=unclassified Pseudomonas TaxID=196821 RepID=UPI001B341C6C|nr:MULTISPECIES: NACHT domain-containing protein [unclassified Pseudomonas]
MKEVDLNGVAVELVKQFAQPLFTAAKTLSKNLTDKFKVRLDMCLTEYIKTNYFRYSRTKTLLYRGAPVNLRDFYVRTDLSTDAGIVSEDQFIGHVEKNQRIVITGTAGSGKSTFCRSVFVELVEKPQGIFPVFVELRNLNTEVDCSLLAYVLKMLQEFEVEFTKGQLDDLLRLGKVLLIFDGFDEINNEKRDVYEAELTALSNKYRKIMMLVSSRPDHRFGSWENFYQYDVLPLDKEKALSLVEKLNYDAQVKAKFLQALDKDLYDRHESFAENPLLLTMMLLTYEQIAEIPNKVHLFYEQAFLTLFNKHDSLKSLYKRKSWSGLPLDDFKKVLSAFSVLGYADRKYSFSESELLEYVRKAGGVYSIAFQPDEFIRDLLDSVCILQRDGLNFTFTHRSFQEYFTALFLVGYVATNKFDLFGRVSLSNSRDDVIPMVFDMNKDLIEQEWIIPRLEKLKKFITVETPIERVAVVAKIYDAIRCHKTSEETLYGFTLNARNEWATFLNVVYQLYRSELVVSVNPKYLSLTSNDDALGELFDWSNLSYGAITTLSFKKLRGQANGFDVISQSYTLQKCYVRFEFLMEKLESLKAQYAQKQKDFASMLMGG